MVRSFVFSNIEIHGKGFVRLKKLIDLLNEYDQWYPRTEGQVQFHRHFISACIEKILGRDTAKYLAQALRLFRIEEPRKTVVVCTPRRFGKTTATALFACCYIQTQENCVINIYSTAKRVSEMLLEKIKEMMEKKVSKSSLQVNNKETIQYTSAETGKNIINSYPSNDKITDQDRISDIFRLEYFRSLHLCSQKKQ
jgi:tRNA(Met) C34 N-acetyltransferase TmcA